MTRAPLLLAASALLASCASSPPPSHGWWKSLSANETSTEATSESGAGKEPTSCRGVRAADEVDKLAGCWPQDASLLALGDVAGLEEMPPELRDCVLSGLPALGVEGADRARCHQSLAEVVDRRLYQLGWLRAEVTSPDDTGAGSPASSAQLAVRLGQRYQIGHIFVTTGPNPKIESKRIIKQAQKAIPKRSRWCTQATLEDMWTRVYDMARFQQVRVVIGAPDEESARAPVVINVQE
jgi:hypothetical protein